jgi:hypothetical protein
VAASLHGDTPYSGNSVTPVPVTPYTTSVDVNPSTHQHPELAGMTVKRPVAPLVRDQEADRVMTDRDQLKVTFDSGGTSLPTGTI